MRKGVGVKGVLGVGEERVGVGEGGEGRVIEVGRGLVEGEEVKKGWELGRDVGKEV